MMSAAQERALAVALAQVFQFMKRTPLVVADLIEVGGSM